MHRGVVVATLNVYVVSLPRILENVEERVVPANMRFEVVCNSHLYDYFIHRSAVVATVKVGMISLS